MTTAAEALARVRRAAVSPDGLRSPEEDGAFTRKYAPDQPRDDHGRWTADGTGDLAATRAPAVMAGTSHPVERAMAWARIPDAWRSMTDRQVNYAVGSATGTNVLYGTGSRTALNDFKAGMAAFVEMHQRFPEVRVTRIVLTSSGLVGSTLKGSTMAATGVNPDTRASTILLPVQFWGQREGDGVYVGAGTGWHPAGCDSPAGVIVHEFGHAFAGEAIHEDSPYHDAFVRAYLGSLGTDSAAVSGYAGTSRDEQFAEMFAGAYAPGSTVAGEPWAVELRAALDPVATKLDKVDFFTDDEGVVHPIRGSEGYVDGSGGSAPAGVTAADLTSAPAGTTWDADALSDLTRGEVERAIGRLKDHEVAVAFGGPNGGAIFAKVGSGTNVQFTDAEIRRFEGATFTHNHPLGYLYQSADPRAGGNSFSKDDLGLAANARMAEVRAVTPAGTYSMRPGPDGWPTPERLWQVASAADGVIRSTFTERIASGYPGWGDSRADRIAHAESEHADAVCALIAGPLGLVYTRP